MQSATKLTADFKTREQAVYEALRQAIIEGRWGPDEGLVVSRIALDLGVSRITVANALKRLAGEGFVDLTPHKEAVVNRLDPAEIREIYLMRAELSALAAREAASRMTPADLDALRRSNDDVARREGAAPSLVAALRAADRAFHRELQARAGMPRLAQTLENLADQCEYYRARLLDQGQLSVPRAVGHEPLLRALADGDGTTAGNLMREHVLGGMHVVLATLETR